jgi:NADPH:quinone reductase-like Zn-dependent oxidoreductase
MRAIVQTGYGPPERVLEPAEIDPPPVGEDEVLIRVRATSVNTPDWISVAGVPYVLRVRFGLRGPRVGVPGTDVAGVVEAVGSNVADLAPGDEVFGSAWGGSRSTSGAFAELTVAPASKLIRKPTGLPFEDAAGSANGEPSIRILSASFTFLRPASGARGRPLTGGIICSVGSRTRGLRARRMRFKPSHVRSLLRPGDSRGGFFADV